MQLKKFKVCQTKVRYTFQVYNRSDFYAHWIKPKAEVKEL